MTRREGKMETRKNGNMRKSGMRGIVLIVMVFCALLQAAPAFAQEDALQAMTEMEFVDFLRQYRDPASHVVTPGIDGASHRGKCGFAVMSEAARRLEIASPAAAADIRALLAPKARQTSIFSPSGRFRIFYDTSGTDAAALLAGDTARIPNSAHAFAQAVAEVFDSVYQVEVVDIGYMAPPFEETQTTYNISIMEFDGDPYGQTLFSLPLPSSGTVRPTYACRMEIDNDFLEFETRGLDGLRVTAAHEFHHMVQLGSYGLWSSDRWMHEMSSTYHEVALYPDIKDYFQYIRTYMRTPERPMWLWGIDGYELVLWPLYLEKHYDRMLMRDFWTGMRAVEPMTAMRDAIQARGGDMGEDLCSWAQTNFYTGYRSSKLETPVYDDAPALARATMYANQELVAESAKINGNLAATGAMYLRVYRGIDTVSFVVANTSMVGAIGRNSSGTAYELEVRSTGWNDDYTPLNNGWAYRFTVGEANALCLAVLEGGSSSAVERELPFPNPYHPDAFSRMQFPVPRNVTVNRADLYVYSSSMNLIARRESQPIELDDNYGAFVAYDVRTDTGAELPSGVYFYFMKYGGETKTGKFAVVRR
jgi:hypothetical protein